MRLSMNIGFVTNSSFAVHHFPQQVLENPAVRGFLRAFEISQGFIGADLLNRSRCGTVAMTKKQKRDVAETFNNEFPQDPDELFQAPDIDVKSNDILIIYGDEYTSLAHNLSRLMEEAAKEMGLPFRIEDYH